MLQRLTIDLMPRELVFYRVLVNLFQRFVVIVCCYNVMILKLVLSNNKSLYFQPSCPNGLARGQARRLETQTPLMMMRKPQLKHQ